MDSKITLLFDQEVIRKAKEYAESQHISLSRLTEYLLRQATRDDYQQLEDMAIAFYFSEKKTGTAQAKKKVAILTQKLRIAPNLETGVLHTIENSKISDFENGMEYYAAIDAGCEVIVTEDTKDFWFSEIEVMDCEAFIKKTINSPL